jgi:hypothetical protein
VGDSSNNRFGLSFPVSDEENEIVVGLLNVPFLFLVTVVVGWQRPRGWWKKGRLDGLYGIWWILIVGKEKLASRPNRG